MSNVYQKFAPDREPKLLIEEFMEGSIHSVDAFVEADGTPQILEQIVDYQTGYDIGYEDNFHYSRLLPSRLDQKDQQALRHCAKLGVCVLGMKNTPAHIEIIMTREGPRIVEIGARNGGYRERMHKLANDIDITGAALSLSFGNKPKIMTRKSESCAVLELFPHTAGTFAGILNEDKLLKLSSLKHYDVKVKIDSKVGKSSDGYKMCAVIILHNSDKETFLRDLNYINENVMVTTNSNLI